MKHHLKIVLVLLHFPGAAMLHYLDVDDYHQTMILELDNLDDNQLAILDNK